jgi:hypothetical protein
MRLFAHVENQLSHTASRREKQQNGDGPGMDGVGESFTPGELALLDNPAGAWMGRLLSALLDANQVGRGFGDVPAPIGTLGDFSLPFAAALARVFCRTQLVIDIVQ